MRNPNRLHFRNNLPNHPHPMILRIPNVDRPVAVDEDAVRTAQLALERVAVGAVALLSRAAAEIDLPGFVIDNPDGVVFGIRKGHATIGRDADALGPRERRLLRRAAVAGEAGLAG